MLPSKPVDFFNGLMDATAFKAVHVISASEDVKDEEPQKYQETFNVLFEESLLRALQSRSSRDIRGFFWVLAVPFNLEKIFDYFQNIF